MRERGQVSQATESGADRIEPGGELSGTGKGFAPCECDVAVVGGGLGGLAASIHLRRAGLRVLCIEPDRFPHARVGESLDWSSPGLMAKLGVPGESLIRDQVATYKRNIEIVSTDRPVYTAQPAEWFRHRPLGFPIVTLHVDRVEMDQRFFQVAKELGVEFLWDRAVEIETESGRVRAIQTASGRRVEAPWFIDASGRGARLFARKFKIPKIDYGRKKICFWTQFEAAPHNEGTTFYGRPATDEYLIWTWEIPITPRVASIGCVLPSDFVKEQRRQGKDVRQILWEQLGYYPRFSELLESQPEVEIQSVSYQSYLYDNACGPNWLIVGEAASLPDPLTANGVTAAFRHAYEGTKFILESLPRGELTARQRWIYNTNLKRMGRAFNHSIETAIYENSIRWGLGVMPAQKIYTAFSYTVNALYSKFQPRGWPSMLCFGLLYRGVWMWMESWAFLGRLAYHLRPAHRPHGLQTATR